MDIYSFTTIILFLFVIIGAYLLFTNSIEGRAKLVLVVAVFIVFVYILMNLPIFNSYSEVAASPTTTVTAIEDSAYNYSVSSSYSLSTWIYVNDWNTGLGSPKYICTRTLSDAPNNPSLYLDTNTNDLKILFNISGSTSNAAVGVQKPITVKNIPIQKWVNIVVCFGDNSVDTYINGKLVQTTVIDSPPYHPTLASTPTLTWVPKPTAVAAVSGTNKTALVAGNSYSGYISNSRYYSRFLSPQEVWEIYKGGFSNNMLGNFLNQYNASFVFSKNQTPLTTINIM